MPLSSFASMSAISMEMDAPAGVPKVEIIAFIAVSKLDKSSIIPLHADKGR